MTKKKMDEVDAVDCINRHLNAAMGITNALHFALISRDIGQSLLGKAAYSAFEHLEEVRAAVDTLDEARMARHADAEKGGAS
jgi:hypothetical protein